ncbi:porin family protein [Flavobacterium sp. LS2R12]|uniref:porin family protein n=1 Tax=unclassified Flavobacterium TaxID=196869 RepID=UPI003AAA201C
MKNLKRVLAVVLVTLGATNAVHAQETGASLGIKGGLNMSNLYTEDVDDKNVLAGFNIGLFAQLPITSSLSLQPEVSYTTKGAELQYNNAFAEGTGKFRLNYIEVPVLLKANLTKNFNVQFGPYAAFLVDSKITNESADGSYNFEENVNEDDLNKFDFGVAAGVGFDFDSFGIGARYNYGLSTVGKERTVLGQTYTFPDSKNSVLSVYAAIKF